MSDRYRLRREEPSGEPIEANEPTAACVSSALGKFKSESGQGTSEYAILIGVVVVAAVVAILLFGDQLGTLWDTVTGKMADVITATTT